jgi:anti-sigma28 factor (negative regulator of flagellin synthesis)
MRLLDTLAPSRRDKVLLVRRQIAEGTYDLDPRLDAILDRLLEDLVA